MLLNPLAALRTAIWLQEIYSRIDTKGRRKQKIEAIQWIQIKIKLKTFDVVTSVSMALPLTVALLSIIGTAITGLYAGIIVLIVLTLLAMIPIALKFCFKKTKSMSIEFQRVYYTSLTFVNLLTILIVYG